MGKCFVLLLVESRQIFTQWKCYTNEKARECKVVNKNNLQNRFSLNIRENNHTCIIFDLWCNYGHAITRWLLFQYRQHFKAPKFPNIFVTIHQTLYLFATVWFECIWSSVSVTDITFVGKNNKLNILKLNLNEIIFFGDNNHLVKCS